ncbi:hypothetical protein D3C75_966860 [compost metagenome]
MTSPTGIPITVESANRIRIGRSICRHPLTTVSEATVRPANPIKETEVCIGIGSSASSGMLTIASPKPNMVLIKAPINTATTTSVIIVTDNRLSPS